MGFILREQKGSKLTIQEMDGNLEYLYNLDQLKQFKPGSVGEKVSFTKVTGTNPSTNKDVIIPGELEITRGNSGKGIFNIALESSYNDSTYVSPLNTFWNTQYVDNANTSWAPLWDVQNRTYTDWRDAADGADDQVVPQYVGMYSVMKWDNGSDPVRYWLIKFTHWGVGNNGDYGFAYERYEIFSRVYFEKNDYDGNAVDIISPGVHLKRNNNRGLYNAVVEDGSQEGSSPVNTKWNSEYIDSRPGYSGWDDLSNLESRVYTSFVDALDGSVGDNINTDLVMWDMTTDLYYKINFDSWTENGDGGGFAYYRTVIPQSNGIKFADGSVMNTSPVVPVAPYKVYTALLTQSGTNDPTVEFTLENTIGITPTLTRFGPGQYSIFFSGLFPFAEGGQKVALFFTNQNSPVAGVTFSSSFPNTSQFNIATTCLYTSGPYIDGQAQDTLLTGTFELRVYN